MKIVNDFSTDFSEDELKRYARHFSLSQVGVVGQKKLKSTKVLIIGAGGLGSPASLYLAAAGIGTLDLIDNDKISLENLQRQILYSTKEVSQSKALRAATNLSKLNPEISITGFNEPFGELNARKFIENYDIIVDASDNFETRYLANRECVLAKKPLVFGAIFKFDGQVSVFAGKSGPCYACVYPTPPALEAVPNCSDAGVLGVLPGVIGTLMATEVIKVALNLGQTLVGRMLTFDALSTQFQTLEISKRKDCLTCGAIEDKIENKNVPILFKLDLSYEVQNNNFKSLINSAKMHFVDVRTKDEFNLFHIPGSQNIPLSQLSAEMASLPNDKPLLIICQSGKRSAKALEWLVTAGRTDTKHLAGGLNSLGKIELL